MNNLAFLGHLQRSHQLGGEAMDHTLIVKMGQMKWANTKLQSRSVIFLTSALIIDGAFRAKIKYTST
jgi:hypothetical protein